MRAVKVSRRIKIEGTLLQALAVDLQCPALLVPVAQHNALRRLAVNLQLMGGGAMGVAMNQRAYAVLGHDARHFVRGDVDNLAGFHPRLGAAFIAQFARQFLPGAERQVAQDKQRNRVAQPAAQLHIADVLGAQAVAVHQQHALAIQFDHAGIGQQGAAGFTAEGLAEEKVAIAMHQVDARAALAELAQGLGNRTLKGGDGIVADPHFKEVAEDIQRLGLNRAGFQKMQKRPADVRALLFKMQIGDQQYHSTISARSMITSSRGTSWWPDFEPVATPLIFSTTSMPSTTSANTV